MVEPYTPEASKKVWAGQVLPPRPSLLCSLYRLIYLLETPANCRASGSRKIPESKNMKSIRIVGEVVRLLRMSQNLVSSPLEYSVEVEHDVRGIFAVVAAPPTPMDE